MKPLLPYLVVLLLVFGGFVGVSQARPNPTAEEQFAFRQRVDNLFLRLALPFRTARLMREKPDRLLTFCF
jgi:hypothetical protein